MVDKSAIDALAVIQWKMKMKRGSAEIEEMIAAGEDIYTEADWEGVSGQPADPHWGVRKLSENVVIARSAAELKEFVAKTEAYNTTFVVAGRKAMDVLISECYGICLRTPPSVFKQLRSVLKSRNITVHEDATDELVMVRYCFKFFDNKQVHIYSRAMGYARDFSVTETEFVAFKDEEGGYESIRAKTSLDTPGALKRIADKEEIEKKKPLVEALVDQSRKQPFLTVVGLTPKQKRKLEPVVLKDVASGAYTKVLVLAEIQADTLYLYQQVPHTPELDVEIQKALLKATGTAPASTLAAQVSKNVGKVLGDVVGRKSEERTRIENAADKWFETEIKCLKE